MAKLKKKGRGGGAPTMGKLRKGRKSMAANRELLKVLKRRTLGISDRVSGYLQRIFPVLPTTAVRFFPQTMAIIWNNSSMSQITGHQNELVTTSCHFLCPTSLSFVTIFVFQISILGKYRPTRFTRLFALGENKKGTCPPLQIKFNISALPSPSAPPPQVSLDSLTLLNFPLLS